MHLWTFRNIEIFYVPVSGYPVHPDACVSSEEVQGLRLPGGTLFAIVEFAGNLNW